ncbi:hypothetical protein F2P56_031812 [Juglans regia]|uniref:MATH domain-containing protein n=2 Tax=Juglans regia TaxID=51240 RepID=A0A833TFU8_JUGRE|nr:uncharacterized protein LOC109016306 [Juglans regia]KAF5446162.1 hypothetical protein F2P56_031812 [Juglans regia]
MDRILRSKRDHAPAHYKLKILSYSLLSKAHQEKYESSSFGAGEYRWRLSLFPNGNLTDHGNGYISLYLAMDGPEQLPRGEGVDVSFKLFVLDQKHNKYLTIQDSEVRRFDENKTEWGFGQLLSLEDFKSSCNGYLVEDTCVFGAEVFVNSPSGKWECLSMLKKPANGIYTYKMENFATLNKSFYHSKAFKVGERNWKLKVYPKGNDSHMGKAFSVYLELVGEESWPPKKTVYAEFKLRVVDQLMQGKDVEKRAHHTFSTASHYSGYGAFMSLVDLYKASKGFIKNGTLIVEVQILVMSQTEVYSECP